MRRKKKETLLRPARPNVGLQYAYRRRLDDLIRAMNDSVTYWLRAAFKADPPKMAADALPADELRKAMRRLGVQWERNFDEAAPKLAEWFARASRNRSDAALRAILRKAGISVEFRQTAASRDILQATINANVALIKSIPEQYLTQVEGMVMRSVQTGRDAGQLYSDIREQFGVTRRRAALIARDQNAKATSAIQTARQKEAGITHAVWMHSGGGRHPRPTHVAMNGKQYEVSKGMYDSSVDKWIFPGELINCRCVMRSVIPGFD
jgi:SPP1 gp7 family putative phage head morphogenesis protein